MTTPDASGTATQPTDEQIAADLAKALDTVQNLVSDPTKPGAPGPLNASWVFLQVYSVWALRLPGSEGSLKTLLGTLDIGSLTFFPAMVEGLKSLNDAGQFFQEKVFNGMVKVARSILDYAQQASQGDSDVFGVLKALLDRNNESYSPVDALELIKDLRATVTANLQQANDSQTQLSQFKTMLVTAQGKLQTADDAIEKDGKATQDVIDKSQGGSDVTGSLKNLQTLLDSARDEYDHDVVVATTTLTYAWVFPIGTISGVVVAGVYGDRAVKALARVNELETQLAAASATLNTALQTQKSQTSAKQCLSNAISYTDAALVQTTVIQNAWSSILGGLDTVQSKVALMIGTNGQGEEALKATALVNLYATAAGKAWSALLPPLQQLTLNPYINVKPGNMSLAELANEVDLHVRAAA